MAQHYFGSWRSAIEVAGIDYKSICDHLPPNTWTKRTIKKTIQVRHKLGLPLNGDNVRKTLPGLMSAARRIFGSWRKTVEASGIRYERVRVLTAWNKRKIILAIQRRKRQHKLLNVGAVIKEDRKLVSAADLHFGSWNKALKTAGFNPDTIYIHRVWSKEKVLSVLRKRIREGRAVNRQALIEEDMGLQQATDNYFGSWGKAIRKLGYDPNAMRKHHFWSEKEILQKLSVLIKNGEAIDTISLFKKDPKLFSAIQVHMGGLHNALARLGVSSEKHLQYRVPLNKWVRNLNKKEMQELTGQTLRMIHLERSSTPISQRRKAGIKKKR